MKLHVLAIVSLLLCAGCDPCASRSRCCNFEAEIDNYLSGKCNKDLSDKVKLYLETQARQDIAYIDSSLQTATNIVLKYPAFEKNAQVVSCNDRSKIDKIRSVMLNGSYVSNLQEFLIGSIEYYSIEAYENDKKLCEFTVIGDRGGVLYVNDRKYDYNGYLSIMIDNILLGKNDYDPVNPDEIDWEERVQQEIDSDYQELLLQTEQRKIENREGR